MTRNHTTVRSRSLGQLSVRPRTEVGRGPDTFAFSAATEHPFDLAGKTPRCAGADPELFWPASQADAEAARAICRTCPLKDLCLAVARERREWGVWGGELLAKGRPTTELPGNVRPSPHERACTA
jgi:hypothetical protein